jgi:tRNA(fMet)-specific endonuclease VapC
MKYLLDTDHISFLQRRNCQEFKILIRRMSQFSMRDFALSIVSFHEQTLGAHNLINRAKTNNNIIRGYNLLSEILKGFATAPVINFDAQATLIFEQMREQKIQVATMDLRIGCIAIANNLIL